MNSSKILDSLGFVPSMTREVKIIDRLPFLPVTVDGVPALVLLTTLGSGLAWSRRFIAGHAPVSTHTEETDLGPTQISTYSGVSIPGIEVEGGLVEAPVSLGPVIQPRGSLPVAGLLGPLEDAKAVAFDFGNALMGISVDASPRIPDHANLIRLRMRPGLNQYEVLTDDVYFVDLGLHESLRMGLSVAHPYTILSSRCIERIPVGLGAKAVLRFTSWIARRFQRASFSWLAQLGNSTPTRLYSLVARPRSRFDDMDGYVGADVLSRFTCVFCYDLREVWLLSEPPG